MLLCEPQPSYSDVLRVLAPTAAVERAAAVVLSALFLPGGPRGFAPPRRRWPEMLHALRAEEASLASCGWALRRWGFTEESLILESPGLLAWAEARHEAGEVLTATCPNYPAGWRRQLGAGAPPAVWMRGAMPAGPFLAVVGSRNVGSAVRQFAWDVGVAAVSAGYGVCSGAAPGCDRAAAQGACHREAQTFSGEEARANSNSNLQDAVSPGFRLVEILPCGLGMRQDDFAGSAISPFALEEPFSGPSAMIRNALIYAMADAAVVVHARFGEGGTWRGATEAKRRGLCPLIVYPGFDSASCRAARALAGLGAAVLDTKDGLASALRRAVEAATNDVAAPGLFED